MHPRPRRKSRSTTSAAGTPGAGQVRLADRTVEVAQLKQHPDRYTGLFGRARSEIGHAVCLCRTDEVVRLVIRCRSGRYHLANWPSGGHQHAPGCSWYRSPSSVSGRSTYEPAIRTSEEGTSIRLSAPLTVHGVSADPATTPLRAVTKAGSEEAVSTTQRSMGLLAFLHYLWDSAQLNVSHPRSGRRDWRSCRSLLAEQARDCRVNRRGLAEMMWIVPAFDRERSEEINASWKRFLNRLTSTGRIRYRGLVLGQIRQVSPTDYGLRIALAHQRAPLYASQELMDRAHRSYPAAFSEHAGEAGRHQVVLCLIERSPRGYPVIQDLAAMLTTSSYVPADSSHETEMADALAAAGRAFVKPLHYDGGSVFPDFVLVDDEPETYVEVWGVHGRESYEIRKRAKQSHYRDSGKRLLEWDVREPLPDLTR